MISMWDLIPVQCVLVVSQLLQMTRVGASDWGSVKGTRDLLGGGGGRIYVCVTEKEREGQQEKGNAVYV